MEIKEIEKGIYVILDSTNIPVIETDKGILLIDAGIDKDKGKKIRRTLEEAGATPKYLLLSHHHADHTGGAQFLKEYFGLSVISSNDEKVFIENPELEPIYLSQGAKPIRQFLNKWVLSNPVEVNYTTSEISFEDVEFLDLSGHSIGMVGVRAGDFVFAGDAFFSKEVLEKYGVPYFYDFEKFRERMQFLKGMEFKYIVPSHGGIYIKEEAIAILDLNIATLNKIEEQIIDLLKEEKSVEEIIEELQVLPHDIIVYTLIESSIKSILNSLVEREIITYEVKDGRLKYNVQRV
jgi:glyoxylase-like metal-dependent hydrolase (beta-lactamase superfamily II)